MRAIIQRVNNANVSVDGNITGQIDKGLLILLGAAQEDTPADRDWLIKKILQMRIFQDDEGRMNDSIVDKNYDILLISQFTLFGNMKKGARPSFNRAAEPELAKKLYEDFAQELEKALGKKIPQGIFAAYMDIHANLDGPVTITLDSQNKDL